MSFRIRELERELKSLARQADALLSDGTKSMSEKHSAYDNIKAQIDTKAHQLDRERADTLRGDALGLASINPEAHAPTGSTNKSFGAPALAFTHDDIAMLHEAVVDRKSLSLKAEGKAAVNSTDAPMAAVSQYNMTPFPFLRDRTRVLNAIPQAKVTAPSVTFFTLTSAANAAATVAEGATKPTSNPVWTSAVAPVRKIAHVASMTDEAVNDFPPFLQFIGEEMLGGLIDAENAQLLTGSGTGTNITGLANTTGILTRAKGTDTQLDAIAKAMTDIRTGSTFLEPDSVVMHPTDFLTIRLAKASGSGEYLASDPLSGQANNIWGVNTLVTTKMTQGTALVANLASAAIAYVREMPRLETFIGGSAEFAANVSLIRAEERLALAVIRPTAIVKVTGM